MNLIFQILAMASRSVSCPARPTLGHSQETPTVLQQLFVKKIVSPDDAVHFFLIWFQRRATKKAMVQLSSARHTNPSQWDLNEKICLPVLPIQTSIQVLETWKIYSI